MRSYVRTTIDDRIHALVLMEKACKNLPDYTLGEVMYSALRQVARAYGGDIRFLRKVSTKELLMIIDKSLEEEIFDDKEEREREGE